MDSTSSPKIREPQFYFHSTENENVNYTIRQMRRCDIEGLYQLTTENGWGMERSYLECVFNTDPTGLIVVVTDDGEVIGL